jgi:hypothetical protein
MSRYRWLPPYLLNDEPPQGVAYGNEMAILSTLSIKSVKKIFSIPKDIILAYKPEELFVTALSYPYTIIRASG